MAGPWLEDVGAACPASQPNIKTALLPVVNSLFMQAVGRSLERGTKSFGASRMSIPAHLGGGCD